VREIVVGGRGCDDFENYRRGPSPSRRRVDHCEVIGAPERTEDRGRKCCGKPRAAIEGGRDTAISTIEENFRAARKVGPGQLNRNIRRSGGRDLNGSARWIRAGKSRRESQDCKRKN